MAAPHTFKADESHLKEDTEQEENSMFQEHDSSDLIEDGDSLVEEMLQRHGGGGGGAVGERSRRVSFAPTASIRHFKEEDSFGASVLLTEDDALVQEGNSSLLSGQTFISGEEEQSDQEETSLFLERLEEAPSARTAERGDAMTAFLESSVLLGGDVLDDTSMMGNLSTATCFDDEHEGGEEREEEKREQDHGMSMVTVDGTLSASDEEHMMDPEVTSLTAAPAIGTDGWMQETQVLFPNKGILPDETAFFPDTTTVFPSNARSSDKKDTNMDLTHGVYNRPVAMDLTEAIIPIENDPHPEDALDDSFSTNSAATFTAGRMDMTQVLHPFMHQEVHNTNQEIDRMNQDQEIHQVMHDAGMAAYALPIQENDHMMALQEEERVMAGYVDLGAMAQTQVIRSVFAEDNEIHELQVPVDEKSNSFKEDDDTLLPNVMDETRILPMGALEVAQASIQMQHLSFTSPSRPSHNPIASMDETQLVQTYAEEPATDTMKVIHDNQSESLSEHQIHPLESEPHSLESESHVIASESSQVESQTNILELPTHSHSLSYAASPSTNSTPQSARLKRFPGLGSPLKNPLLQAAKTPTRPSLGSPLRTPQKDRVIESYGQLEDVPTSSHRHIVDENVENLSASLQSKEDDQKMVAANMLTPLMRHKRRKRSSLIWDVHAPVLLQDDASDPILESFGQTEEKEEHTRAVKSIGRIPLDTQVPIKDGEDAVEQTGSTHILITNGNSQHGISEVGVSTPSRWQHYSTPLQSRMQGLTGSPRVRTLSENVEGIEIGREIIHDELDNQPHEPSDTKVGEEEFRVPEMQQQSERFPSSPLVQRRGRVAGDLVFIGDVTADLFVGSPVPVKRAPPQPSTIMSGSEPCETLSSSNEIGNMTDILSASDASKSSTSATAAFKRKSLQSVDKVHSRRSTLSIQPISRTSIGSTVAPTMGLTTWLDMHGIRFLDCGDPVGRPTLVAHRPTETPFMSPPRILYIMAVVKQSVSAMLTRNSFVAMRVQELREGITRRATQFAAYPPPLYHFENTENSMIENKEISKSQSKNVESVRVILKQFKTRARRHAEQAWHAWRLDQATLELDGLQATFMAHQVALDEENRIAASLYERRNAVTERLATLKVELTRLRALKEKAANTDWAALEALTRDTADVQRVGTECTIRLRQLQDINLPDAQQRLANVQQVHKRLIEQRQNLVTACRAARHTISPIDLSLARSRLSLLTHCLPFKMHPLLSGASNAGLDAGMDTMNQQVNQKMHQLDQKMDQILHDQMVIKEKRQVRLVWRAVYRAYDIAVHLVVKEIEEKVKDESADQFEDPSSHPIVQKEKPSFKLYMAPAAQDASSLRSTQAIGSSLETPFGHQLLSCFTQLLLPQFLDVRRPKTPAEALAIAFQELAFLHALDVELSQLVCLYRITLYPENLKNNGPGKKPVLDQYDDNKAGSLSFQLSVTSTTQHRTLHFLIHLILQEGSTLSHPSFSIACTSDPTLDLDSVMHPMPPSLTHLCHRLAALAN